MSKTIHLYIKQHTVTGLKYFGKTTQKDPYKYAGSGKYWTNHLKVHGFTFTTILLGSYDNKEECRATAIKFSIDNNIVESEDWANLRIECLDGGDTSQTENYKKSLKAIGERNKNRKWWNNGSQQCFTEFPPDESYVRGRLTFNNIGSIIGANIQKNKFWINNGDTELMVASTSDIPEGYRLGRLVEKIESLHNKRPSCKGHSWWNNGLTEKLCKSQPDANYIPGRLK